MSDERRSRHRAAISCGPCRRRKRKCDRQNPCQTCTHRGEQEQCSYDSLEMPNNVDEVRTENDMLRARIRTLEDLLEECNVYDSTPQDSSESTTNAVQDTFPTTQVPDRAQVDSMRCRGRYKSLTTWDHIFQERDALQIAVSDSCVSPMNLVDNCEPGSLDWGKALLSLDGDTLTSLFHDLPEDVLMKEILSQYLNSYHPFCPIINPNKFREQLRTFFRSPQDSPFQVAQDPVFLSLVYGMMALAIVNNDPEDVRADRYMRSSLHALQMSNFMVNFTEMTVVCLINIMTFLQRERFQQTFVSVLFGCTLQIARALGLHRDPSHFDFRGLECQSRRHIWVTLVSLDANYAARYGRTTVIDADEWDCKPLEQINDEGVRIADPMPAYFSLSKRASAIVISKQFKLLFRPRARPSYQTVLDVDREIRSVHNVFSTRLNEQYLDNASMQHNQNTKGIRWLFTKSAPFVMACTLIVIHRPFIMRRDAEFATSRATCLQCARLLLNTVEEMELRTNRSVDHFAWLLREYRNIAYVPAATLLCIGLHLKYRPDLLAVPLELNTYEEQSDCKLIENVLARLRTDSDASRIIHDFYDPVVARADGTKDGFIAESTAAMSTMMDLSTDVYGSSLSKHDLSTPSTSDRHAYDETAHISASDYFERNQLAFENMGSMFDQFAVPPSSGVFFQGMGMPWSL